MILAKSFHLYRSSSDMILPGDLVPNRSGEGYFMLDGFGGIHAVGDAVIPTEGTLPVFGVDIARRLAVTPFGLCMMDAFGLVYTTSEFDKFDDQITLNEPNAKAFQIVLGNVEVFKSGSSANPSSTQDEPKIRGITRLLCDGWLWKSLCYRRYSGL